LAVNVDGVKTSDKVDKNVVDALGDLSKENFGDLGIGWVLLQVDGYQKFLGLGINVTNIDTTFVGEENPVAL
jgi:hypothetical protein